LSILAGLLSFPSGKFVTEGEAHLGDKPVQATSRTLLIAISCALLPACSHSDAALGQTTATQRLVSIKSEAMSADYRADLPTLTHLREEALALAQAPDVGYLARYWAGYCSWRIAINGANAGMSNDDVTAHLQRALVDFESSLHQRDDFADAYAAAASVTAWLAVLYQRDAHAMQGSFSRSRQLLSRARELAPENPRVLWVVGGVYLFAPAERGGSKERAIQIYRQMAEVAEAAGPSNSPLPDWGRPEALMSLAFAHQQQSPPDLESAEREAREALRLQPDWHYVRDILLPQIEDARAHKVGALH
jgi:tetratricopeptide (TPR) repeat protein